MNLDNLINCALTEAKETCLALSKISSHGLSPYKTAQRVNWQKSLVNTVKLNTDATITRNEHLAFREGFSETRQVVGSKVLLLLWIGDQFSMLN